MSVDTLRPNANGTTNNGTPVGDTLEYQCVDESGTNDGDTTYVSIPGGTQVELYGYANSIPSGSTINSVTFKWVSKGVSGGGKGGSTSAGQRILVRNGGVNYDFNGSPGNTSGSYAEYSLTRTTRPWDSAAWTLADITALEAGPEITPAGINTARLTQIWVEVDYTAPVGGTPKTFACMIG
jgi:hypothetical protein